MHNVRPLLTSLIIAIGSMFLSVAAAAQEAAGRLVIVGGALEPETEEVYAAFLGEAQARSGLSIAVISAASGSPVGSAQRFTQTLARYGVSAEQVVHVRVAVVDDRDTMRVDESGWRDAGENPAEIAKIENADAIWFTGGDQDRLAAVLIKDDGSPTPMLTALRERLAAGGTIGGTSAGAAMMGPVMITRGEPITALLEVPVRLADGERSPETDRLVMARGMGFLPYGLTDQHFDERGRLARLARGVAALPGALRLGFGVDENTALIVDLADHTLSVAGAGSVTVLDGRAAEFASLDGAFQAEGLRLHVLTRGDRLTLSSGDMRPASYKSATVGDEYFNQAVASGGGMAVPSGSLAGFVGEALLDNAAQTGVERLSFSGDRGVVYRFTQTADSGGYWGRDEAGTGRYLIHDVDFSITPVRLEVMPLDESAP
ncbi:MAG: cyanophycinase [Pseudomonadota bacterium]